MITRYTEEEFLSSKSYDKLALECKYCQKIFYKEKKFIQSSLKGSSKNKNNFCSKSCGCLYNRKLKGQFSTIISCQQCNKQVQKNNRDIKKVKNSFCSRSCAAIYNNSRRCVSQDVKEKIRRTLKTANKRKGIVKYLKICHCNICNKKFMHKKNRKTCSDLCLKLHGKITGVEAGKKSAQKRVLRSKNEIVLFNLLSTKYQCLNNKAIFNGWDADIIIPNLKLAILWNGPWHYRKITKQHSLKQTQNRDKIKIKEILKHKYNFIIIKDCDNKMTPEKAFEFILQSIDNDFFNSSFF